MDLLARSIDRSELYIADEIFFCGTGVQIAAITKIDHRPIGTGQMGPLASDLRDVYFDVVRGKVAKYRHWNTPVYVTEPSAADRAITERLKSALATVDVRVLDHFIVGKGSPYSFAEAGLL